MFKLQSAIKHELRQGVMGELLDRLMRCRTSDAYFLGKLCFCRQFTQVKVTSENTSENTLATASG